MRRRHLRGVMAIERQVYPRPWSPNLFLSEMARFALNPQVSGVVDVAPEYRLEEIEVADGSEGVGAQIADIRGGAIIVGVRSAAGMFHPQPPSSTVLHAGDSPYSLAVLELVARLEYRFGVAVPDEAWPRLTSIGAVADYLVEVRAAAS